MMFDPYDEFPHNVKLKTFTKVSDGAGGYTSKWTALKTINAFVDTPSSKERLIAQQAQNPLDRYMYFPYGEEVLSSMRIEFDRETYEIAGRPEDQGGQREIMRVALKLAKSNA